MISGIYSIKNINNNHIYIGSSSNIKKRWNHHLNDLRNNVHHSEYLQRAWNKYGEDSFNFCVLEECSLEELINKEQHYLDSLHPEYNICKTANSTLGVKRSPESIAKTVAGNLGRTRTVEQRERISKGLTGRKVNKRAPISEETKKKIGEKLKGTRHSDESIARQAEKIRGRVTSQEVREKLSIATKLWWERKDLLGIDRKHTEESRAKNSASHKGHVPTDEARANMSKAGKLRWEKVKRLKLENSVDEV